MASAKVIDLDSQLGFDAEDTPKFTKRVKLLGQEWTIICDLNSFAATNLTSGDAAGIMNFLQSMIAEAEWPAFAKVASSHPALRGDNGENLLKLLNAITEVAGERPTQQSSISPRGDSGRTSRPKSAANSSAARVVRSQK